MAQVPDIPQLSADFKSRIWAWAKTNMGIVSEFYEDGQFHFTGDNANWYCGSPCFGALAATMYRYDPSLVLYRKLAIDTTEAGFLWNLKAPSTIAPRFTYVVPESNPLFTGFDGATRPSASIDGGAWGTPDPFGDGDESSSMEAGSSWAWTLDMLYASGGIDKPTALRWLANLKLVCDWLIDYNGNPIWYTNGNYVAHQMLLYTHVAKMCRVLGDTDGWVRYSQAYELTYGTLTIPVHNQLPASTQWNNYGYVVDVPAAGSTAGSNGSSILFGGFGTATDGSTETGHLTETPTKYNPLTSQATFDGAYTQLQMDILASIFVINRDWRINWLLNSVFNKLETITNWANWTIDCTGGSRQTGVRGWTGGYQNVIALLGARTSNRTNLTNAKILGTWDNGTAANLTNNGLNQINWLQPSLTRQWRIAVATTLHACYLTDPKL